MGGPLFRNSFRSLPSKPGTHQNYRHAQHNIIGYFRYVVDILLVYDENLTDIYKVHDAFNNTAPTIKFTLETETDFNINFIDVSIHNKGNQLTFNIHRKPTTTNVIIPIDSCHPVEQKNTQQLDTWSIE
jgi:hypothetical protein